MVGGVLLGAAGFAAWRLHAAFGREALPVWMQFREHDSPDLPRAAWSQFQAVMRTAEREAEQRRRAIGSVRFIECAEDPSQSVLWTTERVTNLGYDPLSRVERSGDVPLATILGYYTAAGEPIGFTTRHQPNYPMSVPATLHLGKPLAPGATEVILRRERLALQLQASSNQGFDLALPLSLWGRSGGLHVRALWLGENANLLKHSPEAGTLVLQERGPLVVWFDQPGVVPRVMFARR